MALLSNGRYANITATLALIISLGGVSYAAVQIPKNSVGSKQIKNGAIQAKDVKPGVIPTIPTIPTVPPGPRAYAQLNPDGSVEHSQGITAAMLTLGGTSQYCLKGLGFTPQTLSASPALTNNDDSQIVAITFGPNGNLGCPEDSQVLISTHTDAGSDVRFPVILQVY
jgi:hypothetical protein